MLSKFLYFVKKETFLNIYESFPESLSPLCFLEDSNEIWFNGHFFLAGHESITVSEINNIVTVSLSEDSFNIQPGSDSISIRSSGKNIIISSNALTRIDTDDYLEWRDNKLYHAKSGVTPGSYGPQVDLLSVSSIPTYSIDIDQAGHITNILQRQVTVRDYVELRRADSENKERLLLLAERDEELDDTNFTRKSKATYNNISGTLTTPKMILQGIENDNTLIVRNGNVIVQNGIIEGKVKGDIDGVAVPKIHISRLPDYGGASLNTYGHVKLVDVISDNVQPSSTNEDTTNTLVEALAASPYAVKNYFDNHKMKITAINNGSQVTLADQWSFGVDFESKNNEIQISWTEVNI